ncbi:glycosyltransferase family protein [Flexibacterium corallicola]|uniref:glycosyltransferase family protein n=1 Tax=Flexibacterium corallicola TaxID=3037259 RepID=UPI00286F07E0|nr:glycosyltransferase [Pseudovibrio sp. M1P-2-3]
MKHAFIMVQHLLGTGHVVRASLIGTALARRGVQVTLVSGGKIPPTLDTSALDVIALPAVKAKSVHFDGLVREDGSPPDEAWWEARSERLKSAFLSKPYDLLLTETFPFGRRMFAREMLPLLELARTKRPRPLIAASIRDILVRKQQLHKEEWMAEQAINYYDCILVHADPALIRLEDSFPFAARVNHLIAYTGFVSPTKRGTDPDLPKQEGVVVSCGGGAVGTALLQTAINARALSKAAGTTRWRILVGHDIGAETFTALCAQANEGLIIERARPDFPQLIAQAKASISQAGYNTVLDLLATRTPAVLVPFAQGSESEQLQRARILAKRGRVVVLEEADLSAKALAHALDHSLSVKPAPLDLERQGASSSAQILLDAMTTRTKGEHISP